ncbi:MAG: SusC/RagA family TonB-linked outer membrane protein [Ferruginibacter sp.]|uniref:SusC/RagA family TonB-linked outer membrane protein n=1 Tax=Ferruginibacter sp. TaxID=1940288 RepID=UPI002659604F|nr:SusC/RagA family TonB-linked outer membrane protein [Ferruginibacter sp.]MDB5277300.1 SusC/RagA family TonB-linked outer membrane protein [Ferruginibacter sp.]
MKKLICCICGVGLALFYITTAAWAQNGQPVLPAVKGTIINEKKEPVLATVTVKGTKKATATNAGGEFLLQQVAANAVLLISGTGIRTFEIRVNGRSGLGLLNAVTKVFTAEAVVVEASTGYQSVKPNEVNGAVVLIDNKTLNQQVGTNILKRLDGVTSGLLFNIGKSNSNSQNNTGISIRGLSTINGPLDPLIVLDGFIYEGNISNINPNDIENVTILKDAAAASVWGARAGNGVIVITTKKGSLNQKMSVSVNSTVIVQEKPNLFYLPQMASADYINVEELLFNNGYFDNQISYQPYLALTPAVAVLLNKRNNTITAAEADQQLAALKATDARNQYNHYVYHPAVTQQYAANIRGGNSNNAYTFAASYDKNISELKSRFNKLNLKAENVFQPVKNVKLDVGVYYTNSHSVSGMPGYGTIRPGQRYAPYYSIADNNGSPLPVATTYNPAFTDTAGGGKLLDWKYYPLDDYQHDRTTINLQELYANFGINYAFSNSLTADVKYQYQNQTSNNERLQDINSYEARNTINAFSQFDPATGVVTYIVPPGGIRNLGNAVTQSHTFRGQLNFKKAWGLHGVNAIAGIEQRQVKGLTDEFTSYGYTADPLTIAATDFVNGYPDFIRGYPNTISGQPRSSATIYRFTSLYGNASYTFRERYSVSASARRDGSNIFGANTNDKWKPLWSVGAGWKISGENFYNSELVNYLKLRVSYGYSGNVDLSKTALPVARYVANDRNTNYPYSRIQVLNNPDLRWEQSRQLNTGLDFALKSNVLSGSVDWYSKWGTDLYGETLFDYTTSGLSNFIIKNAANTKGTGIDIVLRSKNIDQKIKWSTSVLFSYNKTITTQYYGRYASQADILLGGGNTIIPVVGKELYGIVAYKWGGLDATGNPQGYVNGQLSTDYNAIATEVADKELKGGSIVYIGSGTPHYFGSLVNTFSWKQFSLAINISAKLGYYFLRPSINYDPLIYAGGGNKDYARRWQKPGDEKTTSVPSFVYPNDYSRDNFYGSAEVNYPKGAHLRLQYINLAYTPGIKFRHGLPFTGLELYANAANLGILWRANKQQLDPDYPATVPPAAIWAFGVRFNF